MSGVTKYAPDKTAASRGFDAARRSFLTSAAAAAGVALAPGVMLYGITKPSPATARPLDAAASSDVRWGMLIDLNRCDEG